jgi:cell division protein FtsB
MKISQLSFDFSKNIRRILIVLGTLLLAFVIFADYGFLKRIELEQQVSELDEQIQQQKHIRDSIRSNIYKLTYDTIEIERIAREKYGMVKSNEEVYHIKKK